jgi:hypothetical protein
MNLGPHDLHLVFNDDTNHLGAWNAAKVQTFACEARNRAVGGDGFGHLGRCPRGEFQLGRPKQKGTVPFGPFFIPVYDTSSRGKMAEFHRAGIGIHGGGSGLPDPFAPHQGWQVTHGCIRTQNADVVKLAALVLAAIKAGGKVYLTVFGK